MTTYTKIAKKAILQFSDLPQYEDYSAYDSFEFEIIDTDTSGDKIKNPDDKAVLISTFDGNELFLTVAQLVALLKEVNN